MDTIISFLYRYGVLATCVAILVEYACFPISSEIVLPLSGAISKINSFSLPILILLSVVCGIIGSLFCFFIGKFFGNRCITYLTKTFPKSKKAFDASYNFFNKYGNKAVLFARLIPLCRTYISFISGILNQSLVSFILYSSIGILLWNSILISLGYVLGNNWTHVIKLYNNYKYIIFVLVAVILGIVLVKKNSSHNINTSS